MKKCANDVKQVALKNRVMYFTQEGNELFEVGKFRFTRFFLSEAAIVRSAD